MEELQIQWNVLNLSVIAGCVNNIVVLDMCLFGKKYCITGTSIISSRFISNGRGI